MMRRRAGALTATTLALITAACGGPDEDDHVPPLATERVYTSERVDVFVEPGTPFCRGDGAQLDTHVERLSGLLGVDAPPRIPVYVVGDDRGPAIADWCAPSKDSLGGCIHNGVIMAKIWAIPHELDHAVLHVLDADVSSASRFWFEAYASAWETHSTEFFPHRHGLEDQTEPAAYDGADHLIRWLQANYGAAALAEFYAELERDMTPEQIDAAFAEVFGAGYLEILAAYEADAAWLYPGFLWCEGAEHVDVAIGETRVSLAIDCDAADTHTFFDPPIEAMFVRRIFHLTERADLQIHYSSPAKLLRVHPCFDAPVDDQNDPRLVSSAWSAYAGGGVPTMAESSTRERVEAGANEFAFAVPLGAPLDLELVIQATPTPIFEGEPPPDGTFLLAAAIDLAPGAPLQFILTVTDESGPGDWQPSLSLQPLSLELGSQTQPREPVGSPLTALGNAYEQWIDGELRFQFTLDPTTIPGAANPFDGTDIELISSYWSSQFIGPDALCGEIEGFAWELPDGFTGTFAAIRIDDVTPAALPLQVPSSCAQLP